VDPSTVISSDMGMDFSGDYADSAELAGALATSPTVRECFARHLFRSAAATSGIDVQPSEDSFVAAWKGDPDAEPGSIVNSLVTYVTSPLFAYRRAQ